MPQLFHHPQANAFAFDLILGCLLTSCLVIQFFFHFLFSLLPFLVYLVYYLYFLCRVSTYLRPYLSFLVLFQLDHYSVIIGFQSLSPLYPFSTPIFLQHNISQKQKSDPGFMVDHIHDIGKVVKRSWKFQFTYSWITGGSCNTWHKTTIWKYPEEQVQYHHCWVAGYKLSQNNYAWFWCIEAV